MKVSLDVLAARLEAVLGAGAVERNPSSLDSYAVDGKSPRMGCLPAGPEQVSAALRICADAEASVIPWGGGTSMGLGNVPRAVDVVIGLARLARLIEHDEANLTATAQAGMTLAALQEVLGERRQFLAIDPPYPAKATVGGLVAANTNGPRRMMYGAVRDQLIGIKMVLADGTPIKAGGKVVKNVAGYDLCKLFVGSLGTLGIITEATFKMAPLPERAATVLARGPVGECLEFASQLLRSTLLPAEIAILNSNALKATGAGSNAAAVAVWTEGFAEGVERHLRDLTRMAEATRLASEVIRDHSHQLLWEKIRDFGAGEDLVVHRLTVPLAAVAPVLARTERHDFLGALPATLAFPGTGTIRLSTRADRAAPADFPRLISLAKEYGGQVVMVAAPPGVKGAIDVWGPPPPTLPIMRELKRRLDPRGVLNPGRFVGGL